MPFSFFKKKESIVEDKNSASDEGTYLPPVDHKKRALDAIYENRITFANHTHPLDDDPEKFHQEQYQRLINAAKEGATLAELRTAIGTLGQPDNERFIQQLLADNTQQHPRIQQLRNGAPVAEEKKPASQLYQLRELRQELEKLNTEQNSATIDFDLSSERLRKSATDNNEVIAILEKKYQEEKTKRFAKITTSFEKYMQLGGNLDDVRAFTPIGVVGKFLEPDDKSQMGMKR